MSLLYVYWLQLVVIEVVTVAPGFVLRAAAGGAATGVQLPRVRHESSKTPPALSFLRLGDMF